MGMTPSMPSAPAMIAPPPPAAPPPPTVSAAPEFDKADSKVADSAQFVEEKRRKKVGQKNLISLSSSTNKPTILGG